MQPGTFLEAGVDEAGRGPLAGPVVVAAVILPASYQLESLDDSKRLTALKRERLAPQIESQAISFAVEFVEVDEIDRVNILQATMNGMQRAVENLKPAPHRALIDGNRAPPLTCEVRTVVGGDALIASISAASVLAKVYRDRLMLSMHGLYPDITALTGIRATRRPIISSASKPWDPAPFIEKHLHQCARRSSSISVGVFSHCCALHTLK